MSETLLTSLANVILVIFTAIQIVFLKTQKQHTRIALTEQYRQIWNNLRKQWGNVIFIGREDGEYYQVFDKVLIDKLKAEIHNERNNTPTIWALESVQNVCGILGEVSTRVLQGHLNVSDIYPIFGTEFLRQSRPMRKLLEPNYQDVYYSKSNTKHDRIRQELQDWLVYHDGLRRRCLILIDLLWAEAAKLEDLPPYDMKSAADAKRNTGILNRKRIFQEIIKLNGLFKFFLALKLSNSLKRAEYRSLYNCRGIREERLSNLEKEWSKRLLRT